MSKVRTRQPLEGFPAPYFYDAKCPRGADWVGMPKALLAHTDSAELKHP